MLDYSSRVSVPVRLLTSIACELITDIGKSYGKLDTTTVVGDDRQERSH